MNKLIAIILLLPLLWQPAAQTSEPALARLLVELWPEYDRAETLVIYRGEVSAETPLPVELTFLLPSYIESLHEVAVEQNGQLLRVDPSEYQLLESGPEFRLLSLTVDTPIFQIEYYDPQILTQQGARRQLSFRFGAPLNIEQTTFEVQQPLQAEQFVMTPPAARTSADALGLTYHLLDVAGFQLGEGFTLEAAYSRPVAHPSLELLGLLDPPTTALAEEPMFNQTELIGYALMLAGGIILMVSFSYWLGSSQAKSAAQPSTPLKKAGRVQPHQPSAAKFCHACGATFRQQAQFCHKCGAARRL